MNAGSPHISHVYGSDDVRVGFDAAAAVHLLLLFLRLQQQHLNICLHEFYEKHANFMNHNLDSRQQH
jgi:hypothetical protein